MLVCEYCKKTFNRVGTGRIARFCCDHCRRKWRSENEDKLNITKYKKICPVCGEAFESVSKTQKCCSKACNGKSKRTGRTTYEKVCLYCNNTFTTINKNSKYCSSICGSRHYNVGKKRYKTCLYCGNQFWNDHFDRYDCCSKECSVNYRFGTREERFRRNIQFRLEKYLKRLQTKVCLWCGKEFETDISYKMCCSSECSYEYQKQKDRDEWAEQYLPKKFYCTECGKKVITSVGDKKSVFCSYECQSKNSNKRYYQKRKEQMKEAYRSPVSYKKIYNRDKGICGICGMFVPDDKNPANIWGATIDHIVPLSKGGTHEPTNCQLAHRLCNSVKLDSEDDYTINWLMKNKEDNRRWTEHLDLYFNSI